MKMRVALVPLLLILASTLPSCEALYLIGGKGKADAIYELPKNKRVLVFVDPRQTSRMPADIPYTLGEAITDHLFKFKAADQFVGQQQLAEARRSDRFEKFGLADVARAAGADVVLHIDVIQWKVEATSDNSLTEGAAAVVVKVVDSNGTRLWPPEGVLGAPVEAHISPQLTDTQNIESVNRALLALLTVRVGRIFHSYDLENKEITR